MSDRRGAPSRVVRSPWPIELHAGDRPKLHRSLDDFDEVPSRAVDGADVRAVVRAAGSDL